MDRTRSRTRAMAGTWTTSGTSTGGGGWSYTGQYYKVVPQSLIIDNPHGVGASNSLHHEKISYTDMTIVLPSSMNALGTTRAQASYGGYVFARGDKAPGPMPPAIDYTNAVNDLIADALGVMPTQVNLLVNAAEFTQLKTLVPSLLQGIGSLFTWGVRQKLGKKSVKQIAGSHLAYSFGLAPLISDFRSLFSIRGKVEKRIKQLKDRNGGAVRVSKATSITTASSAYAAIYGWSDDTHFTENGKWSCTSQGFVSARVNGFFSGNSEAQAKMWASALGLSTPLQTIWELIPFSFVVDWFIPVGNTFQTLERKLGLGTTVQGCFISDWITSSKILCVRSGTMTCESINYPGWNLENCGTCGKEISIYTRGQGIPPTNFFAAPSGWTMNKSALSISLVAQRAFR